jgi:hypothetical protein
MFGDLGWADKHRYIERYRTDNVVTSHVTDVNIILK